MNEYDMTNLGLCIIFATFIVCDTWLFSQGYNAWFHIRKTQEEKDIQKYKLLKLQSEACSLICVTELEEAVKAIAPWLSASLEDTTFHKCQEYRDACNLIFKADKSSDE